MITIKKSRRTAIISLTFFLLSLTQNALTYQDFNGQKSYSSISIFLVGAVSILGGGLFEWLTWFANPLYFTAAILLLCKSKVAIFFSIPATLIAISFSAWHEILVSENGRTGTIISLDSGYLFWLVSFIILSGGTIYFNRQKPILLSESVTTTEVR